MASAMWRQMLEQAIADVKDEKFQQALDGARRVSQFDANNFQALMCVGLAASHLQEWEECETAYRKAAALKSDLPAPWKNLADMYEARKDAAKRLEPLEKLVDIFRRGKKVKPCQKWVSELASAALEANKLPQAFDAWYSLVTTENDAFAELSLAVTPNEELPAVLSIWLELLDLLQRPQFSLSDCSGSHSFVDISRQFFAAAEQWDWTSEPLDGDVRSKTDAAIAFFLRHHLDQIKAVKASAVTQKHSMMQHLDKLALSVVGWCNTARMPLELLLLRSEDADSPISMDQASQLAVSLSSSHPKSPMGQIFSALAKANASNAEEVRSKLLEALKYCSSSSLHESALCVRAQMELASLAIDARDAEGCLKRLEWAKSMVYEKALVLGSPGISASIYSDSKVQFLEAKAREQSGNIEQALDCYHQVLKCDDQSIVQQAAISATELLIRRKQWQEAMDILDSIYAGNDEKDAVAECARGWILFELGQVEEAKELLEKHAADIPASSPVHKASTFKRLAIVYWHLGEFYRQDKSFCFGNLLMSAKFAPTDGDTFSWLGKWYLDIAKDTLRAEKCFLKALSLAPGIELAGVSLSDLYAQQNKPELSVKLWEDMTSEPQIAPTWALLRLAQYLVNQDNEDAVDKLHLVLRNDPLNARYWVILAHLYRHFGKLVSAQKSYLRAIELGETNWCVLCELSRVECSLYLFDEALGHIRPLLEEPTNEACDRSVIALIYADVLFKQAKLLCAQGLYGQAAVSLKQASLVLTDVASTPLRSSAETLKLKGDIHCFSFFLSPEDFSSENGQNWIDFLSEGRKAYEALLSLPTTDATVGLVEAAYDVGLSYWYEAQATCSVHGLPFLVFGVNTAETGGEQNLIDTVQALKDKSTKYFKLALKQDPSYALAWNGLAIVSDHPVLKQFAWIRAIQSENTDAAWANLGMFYVYQDHGKNAATLAQKAFLQLQSINADNPSMWNGYGMLSSRQSSSEEHEKAVEAFKCALQIGLDLDALHGLVHLLLLDGVPSPEAAQLLFSIKKYLERDPHNSHAWNALGVIQQHLGLYAQANASFKRAVKQSTKVEEREGFLWNSLVAEMGCSGADKNVVARIEASWPSEALQKRAILLRVLKSQELYLQEHGKDALTELKSLLELDLPDSESESIAIVALSVAAFLADAHVDLSLQVGAMCKDVLRRSCIDSSVDQSERLWAIELFDRYVGNEEICLSALEASVRLEPVSRFSWTHLGLALIDFQSKNAARLAPDCLRAAEKLSSSDSTVELSYLKALVELHGSEKDPDFASQGQKLVRMQPWNPHVYALAGAGFIKRHSFHPTEVSASALHSAIRLLESGLRVASSQPSTELEQIQLLWLLGCCWSRLQNAAKATEITNHARSLLQTLETHSSEAKLLLEARLLAISDKYAAAKSYRQALSLASSSNRVLVVLYELGALYEEMNLSDCALQVWKSVNSLSASEDAGQFFATLRSAIVHGQKQNTKTAKKQIKTAISLAPSDSTTATVALFVEGVIAKTS